MMTALEAGRALEILLVEDNPGDADLAREELEEGHVRHHLQVVGDGEQALALLHRQGSYADAPRPDLILLDLNLPGKDGLQVLTEVKGEEDLKQIPVVVLTGSRDEEDILRSYQHQADGYLTKPIHRPHFLRVVSNVEGFWLALVSRPPEEPR